MAAIKTVGDSQGWFYLLPARPANPEAIKLTELAAGIEGTWDAAASGTRPRGLRSRGWPNAYGSWNAQLEANSLCLEIRNCLNDLKEDGRSTWTLREVEAVLFMEGY